MAPLADDGTPDESDSQARVPEVNARQAQGVQVGTGNTQHNYFAPRTSVSWPHRLGVVPLLADRRLERPADADLSAAVSAVVKTESTAVVCHVLTGLGGVGKTQLAASLAHRLWQQREVDLLVWVAATARTSILTSYAQAASDVTGVDDPDPEQAAQRFLAWLAETERRWLVVLDDLTVPSDLTGLWPPTSGTGATVVTTRRRDDALRGQGRQLIDVEVFTPAEATAYLHQRLRHPTPPVEAAQLAADLGYLPLALAQAATHINDRQLTCGAYRTLLTDRRRRLADVLPSRGSLPDGHAATVSATWSLSVELADQLDPAGLARPMLTLTALLDPNGIPAAVLTAPTVLAYLTTHRGTFPEGHAASSTDPVDADTALHALACLHQLNLLTLNTKEPLASVRVHALVQRATRDRLTVGQIHQVAHAAADALLFAWPEVEREPSLSQTLRDNTSTLHATSNGALWAIPTHTTRWRRLTARMSRLPRRKAHPVLLRAGESLGEAGLVEAAVRYWQDLRADAVRHLGPDHPDTLTARDNLACWRGAAGDATAAATALADLLVDRLRVLGPNHPDTLTTRNNLAGFRGEAGDTAGAAAAFADLLNDLLRVLGPDHPHTLATRGNLAGWRSQAGDKAGALAATEDLLDDSVRVLGPDAPDTLTTRAALARLRGEAGDPAGATAALTELVADRIRVLGPDHPETLKTRLYLASWRGEAGDAAGAAAALDTLLVDVLRVLGPDHPNAIATQEQLARWHAKIDQRRTP